MDVYIGTFSKEINSTKVPTYSEWTKIDCELKDGVSFLSPVLKIQDSVWRTTYNYLYIPKWSRYYFIDDSTITPGGIWYVSCVVDVLASWKTNILSSSAYVRRSASNYTNDIQDSTWSHTVTPTITKTEIDLGLSSSGCYLVTIAGRVGVNGLNPSMTVYAMDANTSQLRQLCQYMFSADFYDAASEGITDANASGVAKFMFNPFQYITGVMWVPFTSSSMTTTDSTQIDFGWWDYTMESKHLISNHIVKTFSINYGTYSDWTDRDSSWTNCTLYVPGFGQLTVSPEFFGQTLTGKIVVDLLTGDAGLFIKTSDGALVQSATGHLGASIQISNLYEDLTQDLGSKSSAITTGVKAGIGALTGIATAAKEEGKKILNNFALGSAAAYGNEVDKSQFATVNKGAVAEAAVQGAQSALQPSLSTIGANGTRAIIQQEMKAIATLTQFNRYEDIHERLGGVCNKVLTLNTLSGYTEVVNPHISINGTTSEITMINSYLSGGFYIE